MYVCTQHIQPLQQWCNMRRRAAQQFHILQTTRPCCLFRTDTICGTGHICCLFNRNGLNVPIWPCNLSFLFSDWHTHGEKNKSTDGRIHMREKERGVEVDCVYEGENGFCGPLYSFCLKLWN